MLDERKAAILRVVVEEHIATAAPVGSAHVARLPELRVSPATVRNEMGVLEREGYLVQPHTSAGRIPTDKGYRFFVDSLPGPGPLDAGQGAAVRDFFTRTHGELEQMLHDTSRLLSTLTDCAAVVVAPGVEVATVRSIQVVGLGPRSALAVAVLANGVVEKRSLELSAGGETGPGAGGPVTDGPTDTQLAAATSHLAAHVTGHPLADRALPPSGDPTVDGVCRTALSALATADPDADHVYVGGASRMAAAFDAVGTIRQVLSILEQQFVVVTLLRDVLDRGLTVAIGAEHGVQPLADCSVVVASYQVEGEPAGTVGVLGPTRMRYEQALAAVAVVSEQLGRALTEG